MGSVWEGRHVTLGTRVAIKFIDSEYAESKEARSRFDTEARAAAALQSKHAIQIHDHGVTEDERPYMVMELLTGEPLDDRIERQRRITLQETARILGQVCRALQRAHEAGIIHRDLKPENIFLVRSPDDDDEIAKVLDFGIAKTSGGIDGSNTKTGAMLGTPYYMSPEQAQGTRAVDARSDLWSLAVIAFQALSGKLPFESEALGDLLVKIIVAPIPSPREFAPDLPPSFEAWWQRASQRDPAQRFQSARELAESLALAFGQSQGIGGESGAYRPPQISTAEGGIPMNTPQGMAQSTGGYRAVTGAAMAGTQVGMGPTTGATMSRTFDGPGSDALPKKKNNLAVALGGGAALLLVLGIGGVSMMKSKSDAPAPVAAAATVPPPQPTAVVPATPQPPPAPPPATAVALPPEAPATAVAPEKSAAATAPAVTTTAAAQPAVHHVQAMPASPPPAAKPAAAPTKKAAVDLGI
jgi:serine/threonine-protein kinase